jgi:hypothetical protein
MEQPLSTARPIVRSSVHIGFLLAFAIISGVAAWALLNRDREPEAAAPIPRVSADGPRIVTAEGLSALAGLRGSPVYWAGPQASALYEVTETANGYVYVRYLPSGTAPGDPRADFLTIGSYTRSDAYGDLRAAARRAGAVMLRLRHEGLAVYDQSKPTSIYLAYPEATEQVEVYDPSPTRALRLVESGRVRPVP